MGLHVGSFQKRLAVARPTRIAKLTRSGGRNLREGIRFVFTSAWGFGTTLGNKWFCFDGFVCFDGFSFSFCLVASIPLAVSKALDASHKNNNINNNANRDYIHRHPINNNQIVCKTIKNKMLDVKKTRKFIKHKDNKHKSTNKNSKNLN